MKTFQRTLTCAVYGAICGGAGLVVGASFLTPACIGFVWGWYILTK
jgi:hypothetical protein